MPGLKTSQRQHKMKKKMSIGTFNVRGLCDETKRKELATDMNDRKIDVMCLQETKMKDGCRESINGNELTCFPSKEVAYGMGFMINAEWSERTEKIWKVSDRIAVLGIF